MRAAYTSARASCLAALLVAFACPSARGSIEIPRTSAPSAGKAFAQTKKLGEESNSSGGTTRETSADVGYALAAVAADASTRRKSNTERGDGSSEQCFESGGGAGYEGIAGSSRGGGGVGVAPARSFVQVRTRVRVVDRNADQSDVQHVNLLRKICPTVSCDVPTPTVSTDCVDESNRQ